MGKKAALAFLFSFVPKKRTRREGPHAKGELYRPLLFKKKGALAFFPFFEKGKSRRRGPRAEGELYRAFLFGKKKEARRPARKRGASAFSYLKKRKGAKARTQKERTKGR